MIKSNYRIIYVTKRQLEKLNALPVGKEIFLSQFYCYLGGEINVLRTNNGLRYVPNAYCHRDSDGLAAIFEVRDDIEPH